MINISCLLSRWGTWLRLHPASEFATPPAGMRRAKVGNASPPPCSEVEAAMLSAIITSLKHQGQQKEAELILRHYAYGESKSAIARKWKCSEARIRQILQNIESFVAGIIFATHKDALNNEFFKRKGERIAPPEKN